MTTASDPEHDDGEAVPHQISMADLVKLIEILERKREFYHAKSIDNHATHQRGLFLLNGGGAIALATLYGNAVRTDTSFASPVVVGLALAAFLLGAFASLIAQSSYGGYIDRWWQFLPKEQTIVELLVRRDVGEIQEVFHSKRQDWSQSSSRCGLSERQNGRTNPVAFL